MNSIAKRAAGVLLCMGISLQFGCSSSKPGSTQRATTKSLEQILRDEVKTANAKTEAVDAAGPNADLPTSSDDERRTVIAVAAKAFGVDGQDEPFGKLIAEPQPMPETGQRKFIAYWRRVVEFELRPRDGNSQEVLWASDGGASGTAIDLKGVPASLVDVSSRLEGAKDMKLGPNDPLQQALSLSGFPDDIRVTALPNGLYRAEIETRRAEITVDDSRLISAKLL